MKIFLENIFMCLITFWKSYFPPPSTQNPPPHNRKTTKTPPPTPPPQQQKIIDQREKVKNQNHKQILLQKFQTRTRTRSVTGSRVRGFAMRLAVRGFVVRRSWVFWVRDLSLSLFARESFFSLFLSLRVSRNDLKVKFWLKIFSGSKALILRSTKILFRKIHFSRTTKHPHLWKSISGSDLKSKQTQPKCPMDERGDKKW